MNINQNNQQNKSFIKGLVAGLTGAFAVYPIDVVKTQMQNQNSNVNKLYKNGFDCFQKLWKHGKFKSLYRGCTPQMIGVGPEKAVKLFAYTNVISSFDKNKWMTHFYGGIIAGTCQVFVTNPYEMIKINLQMKNNINYKQMTLKKLYTGSSACGLRDIPFAGMYFPLYWQLKDKQQLNPFLSGTLAGAPVAFLCTPADVIKTRIQTLRNNKIEQIKMLNIVQDIYSKEGFQAFWKGGLWRSLRSGPQFGITLLVFEYL
jgi:solute carrier family 25 aspartate/glutamate transporter 12/13